MKYIAYCRKSTDEKDRQILSIEAQVAELTEFAKREGLEIAEFITEARTAKIPGREQFEKLLMMLEKGQAQGIISWHPDRLARNSIDGGKIIYLLDTGKLLDLKFPSHWFENTPQGKFMLSIAFSQSKYYIDNLSENVKRGLRQKLRNGVYPGKAFWGYVNNKELGTIEIDPVESKIIKKAFEVFAEGGKTFMDISRFFYKHGVIQKNGKLLKIDRIKEILSNKFYIGIILYAGEYYDGKHKLFISKELFDRVQKQFKFTERSKPNNKHNLPFLGIMKCGECGASITGEKKFKFYKSTRGKVEYIYYRCTKKLKPCSQRFIQESELEKQLRKVIDDVALPQKWADDWYKWLERDEILEKQNKEENLKRLEQEIKALDQKLNLLLDSYLDNIIDANTYKKKKNELFEEELKKEEEITKIQTNGSSWLEPFREWIGSALSCAKIARAKNTPEELAFFGKTVGSNFFLTNRRLVPSYNLGFAELCAPLPSQSQPSVRFADSLSEPERGFDALWYHLPIPKIWLDAHRIFFIGGNLYYSAMPKLIDMLYVWGETPAKLMHFVFGLLSLAMTYKLARKWLDEKWALLAAVIFYSNLVAGWQSITAYIDLGRTFFEVLAFYLLVEKKIYKSAIVLGLAMATKTIALGSLGILGVLVWMRSDWKKMVKFAGLAMLVSAPWYVFAFVNTGNPVYPIFSGYKLAWDWGFNLLRLADPMNPIYVMILPIVWLVRKKIPVILTTYCLLSFTVWYLTPRTGGRKVFVAVSTCLVSGRSDSD